MNLYKPSSLKAAALGAVAALSACPAQSQDVVPLDLGVQHFAMADGVHIDVPLDLTKLSNVVDWVKITCHVDFGVTSEEQGQAELLGVGTTDVEVSPDGTVDGIHRVVVFPDEGKTFIAATHYHCRLRLHQTQGGSPSGWILPHTGEISGTDEDFHTADPDEPHNLSVSGELSEQVKVAFDFSD